PQGTPALLDHSEIVAELHAQRAERVVHDLRGVRAEEDQIAVLGRRALEDAGDGGIAEELDDGRLQPVAPLRALVDLDIRQTPGAVAADEGGVLVDLRARHGAAPRYPQRRDTTGRILRGTGEDLELAVPDEIR